MRRLLIALVLALPLPALAAEEVKDLRIETRGAAGADARELAVAEATRQAAESVWKSSGQTAPLPALSPTQLQMITAYVDVTNETVQPNYYAGTFNVGINKGTLMRVAGGTAVATATDIPYSVAGEASPGPVRGVQMQSTTASSASAVAKPDWVLIVPAHETSTNTLLWNSADPWTGAWMKAPPTPGLFMAPAGGDTRDRGLVTSEILRSESSLTPDEALQKLARKYNAPAVMLVTMRSKSETIQVGEEVGVLVEYYSADIGVQQSAEGSLFVTDGNQATIVDEAVKEAQRLVMQLVNNGAGTASVAQPVSTPVYTPPTTIGQPLTTATTTAPPVMGGSWQKLWVRMPVKSPADIATYRKQVESIPNTRLEIVSLTRDYMEANIVYNGSQKDLLDALAYRGLKIRN